METIYVWVLHSPYPDGTWRGYEKCCAHVDDGGPSLFLSEQAALDYVWQMNLQDSGYIPVEVALVMPGVRAPFRISVDGQVILSKFTSGQIDNTEGRGPNE